MGDAVLSPLTTAKTKALTMEKRIAVKDGERNARDDSESHAMAYQ
jgi:hypothetical protein